MSRVLLDANILMEIMFARSKLEPVSAVLHDKRYEFWISALTVHILYYFAEIEGIDRTFTTRLTGLAAHLPITAQTIKLAQKRYNERDFEDCLQAACAELGKCDEILTLDKKFAKLSGTRLPVRAIG